MGRTFDVAKISVQGFEPEVVLGMQRIIHDSPAIVLVVDFRPTLLIETAGTTLPKSWIATGRWDFTSPSMTGAEQGRAPPRASLSTVEPPDAKDK